MAVCETIKHIDFVGSPMGSKDVTAVPGVGLVIGGNLKKSGILTAKTLYAHFILRGSKFPEILMQHGANQWQQKQANDAMIGWDAQHN